tara:strand:+ start:131257 stop:131742 length:486 start_codon:yes stop_codon:yes gene_type:complete
MSIAKSFITLFFMTALVFSAKANAGFSNEDCIKNYREGVVELSNLIIDYNEGYLGKSDFVAMVGLLDTRVGAKGFVCKRFVSPNAESCVGNYKKLYKNTRSEFKLSAVVSGNQDEINLGSHIKEDGSSIFSKVAAFFNELSNDAADTVIKSKIALYDTKCL